MVRWIRGRVRVDAPSPAAHQFAWLILGVPLDRGMFREADDTLVDAEFDRIADAAVSTYLTTYRG